VVLMQTTFPNSNPHVVETCALLDPVGVPWYLWMDGLGGWVVSRSLPAATSWRRGFILRCPHMQYRALVRQQQQQYDVLELTGTILEDLPYDPVELVVYNQQPGYLQPA
jgi:hypothetical protein